MILALGIKWRSGAAILIILSYLATGCMWRHNPHYNYIKLKSTDSVEVEKHGDTVCKYYLNYDRKHGSYYRDPNISTTTIYQMIANDTSARLNSFLIQGDYLFFIDRTEVRHYLDSTHLDYRIWWGYSENIGCIGTLEFRTELIGNCKMRILNSKTNSCPKGILCEQFSSKYYQGVNYFLVSESQDTSSLFKKTNYRY